MGFVARLTGVRLMPWPWVSRAAYDAVKANAADVRDALSYCNEARRTSEQRYADLLEKYHALKLAGGAVPEPAPARIVPKPPDVVTQAMIAKARGSRVLLKQFAEYVTEQRTLAVPDEEIALAIHAGIPDDEGVPG